MKYYNKSNSLIISRKKLMTFYFQGLQYLFPATLEGIYSKSSWPLPLPSSTFYLCSGNYAVTLKEQGIHDWKSPVHPTQTMPIILHLYCYIVWIRRLEPGGNKRKYNTTWKQETMYLGHWPIMTMSITPGGFYHNDFFLWWKKCIMDWWGEFTSLSSLWFYFSMV